MPRSDEPIRPMTLGNMRQNGVRGLDVTCSTCGYRTEINVDAADARLNWNQRRDWLPGARR
jgi:hypothetical protein